MSKFDKSRDITVALLVAAGLLMPIVAISGLVEDKTAPSAESARKPSVASSGYLLRCWQEGRLIVEEYLATVPPSVDLTAAKLKALDTDNHAVYVTETKNATCLIRARSPERTRGLSY